MEKFVRNMEKRLCKSRKFHSTHEDWVQQRTERLQNLAKEFRLNKQTLCQGEATPTQMQLLWDANELFKGELLEVCEILNEFFKRASQRDNMLKEMQREIDHIKAQNQHPPSQQQVPTQHTLILTNPFLCI